MKKYAWMLFAVLTVGLLGACAQPAESAAGEAGELAMPGQASRFKQSGDGDRLWLAGWGEGELLVWQSGDGGDSWQREEVDWPKDASPTAVTSLLPGGRMLVSAVDGEGTCLLAGGPGEAFAKLDLPALDGYDGCAAACWVDGQTLSLTPSRYEQFMDEQGKSQTTVAPLPVGNVVCAPGQPGVAWGDGAVQDRYSPPVSDGEKLYCADWTDNALVTVTADGRWEKGSVLEGWDSGLLYAREDRVYYLTDGRVRQYPNTTLAAPPETPWSAQGAVALDLCVTDDRAFVLWVDQSTETPQLYRWSIQ